MALMPRGTTPRRPARTGRQDRVATAPSPMRARQQPDRGPDRGKDSRRVALARPGGGKAVVLTKPGSTMKTGSSKAAKTKTYNPVAPSRIAEILKRLDQLYPDVTCALTHTSAWELLVATILSAQSTDVNVNRVTPELFRKYPTVEAFAALEPEQLQPDVRSAGFFRNKSKSVVGVARKTANVVLGTWFKIAEGVVVDTHVQRISRRLELTTNSDPQKIEQDLMRVIPRD